MASEKKFEPLFSVPCGLQPALSSGDIGIRVAGTLRAESEGAERQDRGNGDHAGHVHLSVLASPAITPQLIVNQMKGYTSLL